MKSNEFRYLAWGLLGVMLVGFVVLLDVLAGIWQDTDQIRRESGQFRAEAAYLLTNTLNLVPNTVHEYESGPRYGIESSEGRRLRTGDHGTIEGPEKAIDPEAQVLFLGGSTTESNEVDEQFRFPFLAGKIMRNRGISVATVNAGVRGHTTLDSINSLLNRPYFKNSDVIVVMHNINDRLQLAINRDYHARLGVAPSTSAKSVVHSFSGFMESVWDYVSYRSNILFLSRQFLGNLNAWTGESENPQSVTVNEDNIDFGGDQSIENVEKFSENLEVLIAIARISGAKPVLMTQALGRYSESQEVYNEAIRKVAHDKNTRLIDLSKQLGPEASWAFLSDDIHLNNQGSEAIAKVVADQIGNELGYDRSSDVDQNLSLVTSVDQTSACMKVSNEVKPTYPQILVSIPSRYPSYSTSADLLIFQRLDSGRDEVGALRLDNGRILRLSPTTNTLNERHPAFWRGDKDDFQFVFGSGWDPDNPDVLEKLKVRHWPSMKTEDLVASAEFGGSIPSVYGDTVVFASFAKQGDRRVPDISQISMHEEDHLPLIESPHEEWRPAVTQDGQLIYFISNENDDFDIFRYDTSTEERALVYRSSADEWDPAISRDGRWLAFASRQHGSWDLFMLDLHGDEEPYRLTDDPGDEWDPTWHPEGNYLAFAAANEEGSFIYGLCPFGLVTGTP